MCAVRGVAESVLYAADLESCASFYERVIGLARVAAEPGLLVALRTGAESVLLLFDPEEAAAGGRSVPAHGARGAGHIAFLVDDLEDWRSRFERQGVAIEQEVAWGERGRSIYVRDPSGNSVEMMDRDIWPDGKTRGSASRPA
jgi:catechol 2,3-dioxygenase-like lactoylglutathione lyase family enzyme